MAATSTSPAETRSQKLTIQAVLSRFGIALALVLLMLVLSILSPEFFLSNENLTNVARQTSVNALLALGEFLVILTAGIDLSVGAVMALAMIMMALCTHTFYDWYAAYYAQLGATSLPDPQSTAAKRMGNHQTTAAASLHCHAWHAEHRPGCHRPDQRGRTDYRSPSTDACLWRRHPSGLSDD
jgi:hypothetical protein